MSDHNDSIDLKSLLGFDGADLDSMMGESWEIKAAPLDLNTKPMISVSEISVSENLECNEPAERVVPRPESATAAWIEHCKQLEELSLSRNSSFSTRPSDSDNGSAKIPPPPPPPPPPPSTPSSERIPTTDRVSTNDSTTSTIQPPNEVLSLQDILDELSALYECASKGLYYDEARLEHLIRLQESSPEYMEQVAAEQEAWRCSVDAFLCESLIRMRSYIPPGIFSANLESLLLLGLTPELSRRILNKKCLWLTRMSQDEIARLHEADLNGRFNPAGENLDVVEMAAIFAALPDRFTNDRLGRKVEWRDNIERTMREWLGSDDSVGVVPDGRERHEVYEAFLDDYGPCSDRTSTRDVEITKSEGSQGPRNSFQEVCKRHSILSLRRQSRESEGAAGTPS